MENKKIWNAFVGPAYESRVARYDCQRLVNMYLEGDVTQQGKANAPAVFIGTPGLKLLQTLGTGPIRGIYTLSNQQVTVIVSGNQVFQISGAGGIPTTITGNLNTSTGPVSIIDNGIQVLMVDGQSGYYYTIGTTNLVTISDPNFYPSDTVTFQDGYFICNQTGTTNFFISDLYSIDFPPLNQASKSGNSDILIAVLSLNRQLYLLGANTTEIWWNAGQSGTTPFQRQDGRFSQVGCAAPATLRVLGETAMWLGSNQQGGGVVYTIDNSMPARVSNNAVEYAIQQAGDLSDATAWSYQQEGHYFYCLNIPGLNTTWCYDVTNQQWHERQSTINGVTGRHLAENHCVLNGVHIVGDYRNGNIYQLDLNYYRDDTHPIYRIRQTPHLSESMNRVFYHLLEVDFQFGTGLVNNGTNPENAVQPRVVLEISNDGGQTWSNPIYATLGRIGQWVTRARWLRLGSSRDRVFRVSMTDPVKMQMLSGYLDAESGNS